MTMFKGKNKVIRKRVMEVIEFRIEQAQKAHDEEENKLFVEFQKSVAELQKKLDSQKNAIVEKHVGSVLGKIL